MSSPVPLSYHPSERVQKASHTAIWPLQSSYRIMAPEHGSSQPLTPEESLMHWGRHSPPVQAHE
jgi:hypothetical protein